MRSLHLPLFGPMDDITTYFIITKKREKEAKLLYTSQSHDATLIDFNTKTINPEILDYNKSYYEA